MDSLHISKAREIMNSGRPFDLACWDSKGVPRSFSGVVSLKYDPVSGTRNIKFANGSRGAAIRKIRDSLIYSINGIEVYC